MNKDIRLSVGFWHHPKTKKTVKRLGLEGIRSVQVLWLWAAQNRPDGNLSGMDWEDIELAADWNGTERAFFDLCVGTWIDEHEDGYALHDWQENNPWQAEAKVRSQKASNAAKARWGKDKDKSESKLTQISPCSRNAQAMLKHTPSNARAKQAHQSSNAPLLSSPKEEIPPLPPVGGRKGGISSGNEKEKAPNPMTVAIDAFTGNAKLRSTLQAFLAQRQRKGKPVVLDDLPLLLRKLTEAAGPTPEAQTAVVEQSLTNEWTGFFPIRGHAQIPSWSSVDTDAVLAKIRRGIREALPPAESAARAAAIRAMLRCPEARA